MRRAAALQQDGVIEAGVNLVEHREAEAERNGLVRIFLAQLLSAASGFDDREGFAEAAQQNGEVGRIRATGLEKNLSQEALAFEAGLTRNYISIIELGRQSATLDIIEALARALETPASALLARAERSIR